MEKEIDRKTMTISPPFNLGLMFTHHNVQLRFFR